MMTKKMNGVQFVLKDFQERVQTLPADNWVIIVHLGLVKLIY